MGADPVHERADPGRPLQIQRRMAIVHGCHGVRWDHPLAQSRPGLTAAVDPQHHRRLRLVVDHHEQAIAERDGRRGIAGAAVHHPGRGPCRQLGSGSPSRRRSRRFPGGGQDGRRQPQPHQGQAQRQDPRPRATPEPRPGDEPGQPAGGGGGSGAAAAANTHGDRSGQLEAGWRGRPGPSPLRQELKPSPPRRRRSPPPAEGAMVVMAPHRPGDPDGTGPRAT